MTEDLIARAERNEYQQLFLRDLHWSAPDHPPITLAGDDGRAVTATNVSSYRGIRVWVCAERPGPKTEAALDRLIARTSTDRLVIFHDDLGQQVWRWPVRRPTDSATTSRLTSHRHSTGRPNPRFANRLAAIRLPLDRTLDATTVLGKVREAFDVETRNETKRASALMARMYAALEKAYPSKVEAKRRDHEISVSLARILFLMFGDRTAMWAVADAFQTYTQRHTAADGIDIGPRLNTLFDHLDTAAPEAAPAELADFPYVNGGLFSERIQLPKLNKEFRDAVLAACAAEWSDISPAIFGSMFQSVRDAQTRRELGEHYTSEENILKTLNPLFLDELRAEFGRARTMKDEKGALNRLWARLGEIRFLDPACGCGNFIIVSYRELRDLELAIMERLQELSGASQLAFDPTLSLKVTLDHFAGIEIDEWPARIAETAMFLIDRQCDLRLKEKFGEAPKRLPIQTQSQIVSGVSALQYDWGQLVTPSDSVIVAGNPPFLGHKERTREQGDELRAAWGTTKVQHLDYVTAWYAKALEYFGNHEGRWAFVSTNSVTQGEGVAMLFRRILDSGWRVKFAHRSFKWESEAVGAAAVHVVVVGFERNPKIVRLFDYPTGSGSTYTEIDVVNVSPYLVDGPDVLVDSRSSPLSPALPELRAGSTPIDFGHLFVAEEDLAAVRADATASTYLRKYSGGKELINGLAVWCLWMDEPDVRLEKLMRSPLLAERIDAVRADRLASGREATRRLAATPHLFGERRQPSSDYLGIPQTFSDSRLFATAARVPAGVIASIKLFTHPDPDGFLFGVICSSMFITWQKTIGGRLKSDPSFSSSLVWNTFPIPQIAAADRAAIVDAGVQVMRARAKHQGQTLAHLYRPDAMPAELLTAHSEVDRAVDAVFGAKGRNLSTLQRQEILVDRYQQMTDGLLASSTPQKKRRRTVRPTTG